MYSLSKRPWPHIFALMLILLISLSAPSNSSAYPPLSGSRHENAIEHLKRNDFDHVIQIEDAILSDDPADMTAYFILAMAYLGKDNEKMALRQAENVSRIDSAFASEIYNTMGRFYSSKKRYHKSLVYLLESLKLREDPGVIRHIASIYLGQGLLKNARIYYEKLLTTRPDYLNLSRIYLAEGNYWGAIAYSRKAIEEDPRSEGAYLVLGTGYLLTDMTGAAASEFRALMELSPDFPLTRYFLGIVKAVEGDLDGAIADFASITQAAPGLKEAHLYTAAMWHLKGDLGKAKDAARKALEADPIDAAAHFVLGNIHVTGKDYDEAESEFMRSGDIFPDLSVPGFSAGKYLSGADPGLPGALTLALLFNRAGLYMQSIKTADSMLLQQKGENPLFTILRARAEARLGNIKEAVDAYSAAIESNPDLLTPYIDLGDIYESTNDFDRAISYYGKAIKRSPHNPRLSIRLAELSEKAGNAEETVNWYKNALKLLPESSATYNRLALQLFENGEPDEALVYALKGTSVNPEDMEMKDTLGWLYFNMGRYGEALNIYGAIIERGTDNPLIHYHAGLVHNRLKNVKGALEALENALNINDEFTGADEAKRMLKKLSGLG